MSRKDAPLSDVLAVRYAFKKLGAEYTSEEYDNTQEPKRITLDQIIEVVKQEFADIGKFGRRRAMNAVYQIMCDTQETFQDGKGGYVLVHNPWLNIAK